MTNYEIWLATPQGDRIESIGNRLVSLQYARSIGSVGYFTATMCGNGEYEQPRTDRRIEVYRNGVRDFVGFERLWSVEDVGRRRNFTIEGTDVNGMLDRHIVAYAFGTTESDKSGTVDDLMKEVIDENFGASATAARQFSEVTIEPDASDGPSVVVSLGWHNVLNALNELQEMSRIDGNEVFYDLHYRDINTWHFVTRTGQLGRDRTVGTAYPLVFGSALGNLANVVHSIDRSQERNTIYVGGVGTGEDREIVGANDTTAQNKSPFNRTEAFLSETQGTGAELTDAGNARLIQSRARTTIQGDILSTRNTPYGTVDGWRLGDKITIDHGRQFDAIIRSVQINVNDRGDEDIQARVEG